MCKSAPEVAGDEFCYVPKPELQEIKINLVMQAHKAATTENAGESNHGKN